MNADNNERIETQAIYSPQLLVRAGDIHLILSSSKLYPFPCESASASDASPPDSSSPAELLDTSYERYIVAVRSERAQQRHMGSDDGALTDFSGCHEEQGAASEFVDRETHCECSGEVRLLRMLCSE
jgi:hypothetical protein